VLPPVEFTVTASYTDENGQTQTAQVTQFEQFVTRTLEITEEQAKQVTTAVVVDADGTVRHVPTNVYEQDDANGAPHWYVTVNSLTNSTYALIYNAQSFTDAANMWYEEAVDEMGSRLILDGVGDGLFAGGRGITRAEFSAMIIRALGLPTDGGASNGTVFTDVPGGAWYYGAVCKASELGLINGVGNNKFNPERPITRQEAMAIIQRAAAIAGFKGKTNALGAFNDAQNVSAWALDAVRWNVGSKLVVGYAHLLRPADDITRAETATLVLNLLRQSGLIDVRSGSQPATGAQAANAAPLAVLQSKKDEAEI